MTIDFQLRNHDRNSHNRQYNDYNIISQKYDRFKILLHKKSFLELLSVPDVLPSGQCIKIKRCTAKDNADVTDQY